MRKRENTESSADTGCRDMSQESHWHKVDFKEFQEGGILIPKIKIATCATVQCQPLLCPSKTYKNSQKTLGYQSFPGIQGVLY